MVACSPHDMCGLVEATYSGAAALRLACVIRAHAWHAAACDIQFVPYVCILLLRLLTAAEMQWACIVLLLKRQLSTAAV